MSRGVCSSLSYNELENHLSLPCCWGRHHGPEASAQRIIGLDQRRYVEASSPNVSHE